MDLPPIPSSHTHVDEGLSPDLRSLIASKCFSVDLVSVLLVSENWRDAAIDHRHKFRRPPSLLLHLQGRQTPSNFTYAFHPTNQSCLPFPPSVSLSNPFLSQLHRPIPLSSAHAPNSRLYALLSDRLAFSSHSFSAPWSFLDLPGNWDSLTALVFGENYMVALGVDEDEERNAVVFQQTSGLADDDPQSDPLPDEIDHLSPISALILNDGLHVIQNRQPRWSTRLDLRTRRWDPPRRLRLPDPTVYVTSTWLVSGRLVAVGATENGHVRFWAVDEETMEAAEEMEGWRMPPEMEARLAAGAGGGRRLETIGLVSEGGFGYLYNGEDLREFFMFEFRGREGWWRRVETPPEVVEKFPMNRAVVGCSGRVRFEWNEEERKYGISGDNNF